MRGTQIKRILIVASTFPRWENDTEPRFILDLAKELARFADVTIVTPGFPGLSSLEEFEGISVVRFRYWPLLRFSGLAVPGSILGNLRRDGILIFGLPFLLFATALAIVRECRQKEFDVIHLHWLFPQALCYRIASWFRPLPPAVVTVHGGDAALASSRLFRPFARFASSGPCGRVTVVSSHLAGRLPWALNPPIIPMGVDLEGWAQVAGDCGKRVVFIGRLAKKKGVDTLLRASGALVERGYEVHIIGAGEEDATLRSISATAVFHGALSKAQIIEFLRCSDVVCLPFSPLDRFDADGTPTVLLEMLAAGVPVVASRVPCVTSFFDHRCVAFFEPGDVHGLVEAVVSTEDVVRRSEMVRDGKELVKRFSWPEVGRQFLKVLTGIEVVL